LFLRYRPAAAGPAFAGSRAAISPDLEESLLSRSAALLLGSLLIPITGLSGQEDPARVPPPGAVRVESSGRFVSFDELFGVPLVGGGERGPFRTAFAATLRSDLFVPLERLEQRIARFMPTPVDAEGSEGLELDELEPLMLSTDGIRLSADRREVPFVLEVGVIPRVSVLFRVPLVQNWVQVTGLTMNGGNVGLNPDPGFNRVLVAGTDTTVMTLAMGRLLPLEGTQAARWLQDTVRVLTDGGELRLPGAAIGALGLTGLDPVPGFERLAHMPGIADWRIGDVSMSARLELVNTIGFATAPIDGPGVRGVVEGGVRLGTGTPVGPEFLGLPPPEDGLGGFFLAAAGDAFLGPRVGVSAHGRLERFGTAEVGRRIWIEGEDGFPPTPIDQTVRWDAGSRTTVSVLPRFQLVDEISLFASFSMARRTGESFEIEETGSAATRSGRRWGIGAMYSTLRPGDPDGGRIPFELVLQTVRTTAGAGGEPAARAVSATLRVYPRLWRWGGGGSGGRGPVQE
jgi:hypothetical protein